MAYGSVFALVWLLSLLLSKLGGVWALGRDKDKGIQKVHTRPTSRLGGGALVFGLVFGASSVWVNQDNAQASDLIFWLCVAGIPVWLGGLAEDLTHKVGPNLRLVLAMLSAAWLYSASGVGVHHTDVWPVDQLLRIPGASLCLTMLVVAGFTHSVNIMDGFHGLASGLCIIMLLGLTALAWAEGDGLLVQLCLLSAAATAGFFVVNWPYGRLFLGDAGAYLLGFWVVELGLMLVMRNPSIAPMAPVVVGIAPLIETLFSMYRRRLIRKHPVNHPDALHLHTLVYRRLVRKGLPQAINQNQANARVAVYFWIAAVISSFLAWFFRQSTEAQLLLMLLYLAAYTLAYRRLVHFRSKNRS